LCSSTKADLGLMDWPLAPTFPNQPESAVAFHCDGAAHVKHTTGRRGSGLRHRGRGHPPSGWLHGSVPERSAPYCVLTPRGLPATAATGITCSNSAAWSRRG
jgi:hypothetical protein